MGKTGRWSEPPVRLSTKPPQSQRSGAPIAANSTGSRHPAHLSPHQTVTQGLMIV